MYYAIYDLNDNLIGVFDTLEELSDYTKVRKRQLKYKFKNKNQIYYQDNGCLKKIYCFID